MEWYQRPVLLPCLHLEDIPQLLYRDVAYPGLCRFHTVCNLFLAAVLLHRSHWKTLDRYILERWLRNLHVHHCRLPAHNFVLDWCRSHGIHVPLHGLLHDGHLASILVVQC